MGLGMLYRSLKEHPIKTHFQIMEISHQTYRTDKLLGGLPPIRNVGCVTFVILWETD